MTRTNCHPSQVKSRILSFLAIFLWVNFATAQTNLTGHAAELFRKAQTGKHYATAAELHPVYYPTTDGKSFITVWHATGTNAPKHWIVSIHGSEGFATD